MYMRVFIKSVSISILLSRCVDVVVISEIAKRFLLGILRTFPWLKEVLDTMSE